MRTLADSGGRWTGRLMIGAAMVFGGVYFAEVAWEHNQAACQGDLNRDFIEALTIRAAPSEVRQDAEDALLGGLSDVVLNPDPTRKEEDRYRALFRKYIDAAATFRGTRDVTPYPPLKPC